MDSLISCYCPSLCGKFSVQCCDGCYGCTCTGCGCCDLPGKVVAAPGQKLGSFVPHVCGCKAFYCPHCSGCECTGCDCGYVTLASAKAKATSFLATIALIAARNVESDGAWQVLLALSLLLTMVTVVLVVVYPRRTIPVGSLKEPLAHDHTDAIPDAEQGLAPSQQQMP